MPTNYNGHLNKNEVQHVLFNMIISQLTFADNIKGTNSKIVELCRRDGSLYGDTKLYTATDVLETDPWGQGPADEGNPGEDVIAGSLLQVDRPPEPKTQAITLNVFRQIAVTVDNYLSKRAFGTEYVFSQYNAVVLGWLRDTKRVYDSTLINAFIGKETTNIGKQLLSWTLEGGDKTGEEKNRLQAQSIARQVADLHVELEDVSRDYNDYGFLRSYDRSDLVFIWNSAYANRILKLDTPTIFHRDVVSEGMFDYILPSKYFTKPVSSIANTTALKKLRAVVEIKKGTKIGEATVDHAFPGELIRVIGEGATTGATAPQKAMLGEEDAKVMFKVMHRDSVPYMSAFEVGTSFYNPKALLETHYLTFGHNTLQHINNYPFITVKEA